MISPAAAHGAAQYPPVLATSLPPAPAAPVKDSRTNLPPIALQKSEVAKTSSPIGAPVSISISDGNLVVNATLVMKETASTAGSITSAEIQGPDWSLSISASDPSIASGNESNLGIVFHKGAGAKVSGTGFAPFSPVSVYLFSTHVLVGTTRTIADGTFAAVFDIPEGLGAGNHTLQLSGISTSGGVRTASIAVLVLKKQVQPSTVSLKKWGFLLGFFLATCWLFFIWRKRRKKE
jgi:large repetitive protein